MAPLTTILAFTGLAATALAAPAPALATGPESTVIFWDNNTPVHTATMPPYPTGTDYAGKDYWDLKLCYEDACATLHPKTDVVTKYQRTPSTVTTTITVDATPVAPCFGPSKVTPGQSKITPTPSKARVYHPFGNYA